MNFNSQVYIWLTYLISQQDIVLTLTSTIFSNHLQTSSKWQSHIQPFLFFNMSGTYLFASASIDLLLYVPNNSVLLLMESVSICNDWWKLFENICFITKYCNILSLLSIVFLLSVLYSDVFLYCWIGMVNICRPLHMHYQVRPLC